MSSTLQDTSIDVLTEIADIVAETLELQDVFARIAASVRRAIPFDNMGVVRIVDGDRAILHASTLPGVESGNCVDHLMPLSAWSPRWRPSPAPNRRINDAQAELDPSYPMDAEVLKGGLGSGLWEPFKQGESFIGGVWLCSQAKYAFGDEHQRILRPIAALLGSAVEHWKIWDAELRRQERLDKLETLLATLAESLDVREIFQRVSDEMQPILPHHMMTLSEIDTRARTLRIAAFAGACDVPVATRPIQISDKEMESACWPGRSQRTDFEIIHDIPAELAPDTERQRLIISSGLRSWLRVPVSQSGVIKGGLSFLHREPSRYKREDAEVALRLADRIALTLSLGSSPRRRGSPPRHASGRRDSKRQSSRWPGNWKPAVRSASSASRLPGERRCGRWAGSRHRKPPSSSPASREPEKR
jgi:GAF domain-containing protein